MTIADRMILAAKKSNLSVSDMAAWFGVTRASMWTWLHDDRDPHPSKHALLDPLLEALERVLDSSLELFPIPLSVRQYERREYIEKVKHAALKLSPAGAASRGRKVLDSDK